jgi:putative AbiEi antitoxin of type IV toxin-antitoxin system
MAATQGGVVTAAQCRAMGVDDPAVRRLLAAGLWTRARRGIYADAAFVPWVPEPAGSMATGRVVGDPTHHAQCAALLASLGRPAVVSHLSAVRLLGLPLPPWRLDPLACITRRGPAPTNDPLLGDVHVVDYDDADVVDIAGVPVLAGARLVLDCCEVLAPDSALAVADAALGRELTTPAALRTALRRRYTRLRAADLIAEQVVERADPLAENWFESSSRWWLLEAGLPRPRLQVTFTDGRGRSARVDMLFDRVVGEADGAGKYDEPGALFAEKQREDWLRDVHRLEVVRWVPAEVRSRRGRAEVAARFARAAARVS